MATLDDLTQGVVAALAQLLFPGQTWLPGSTTTATGPWSGAPGAQQVALSVKLYRGAPDIAELNADIKAGIAHVCVSAVPGMSRSTTRFKPATLQVSENMPTLTAAWTSSGVTFGGTCAAGQVVGIVVGTVAYAYRLTNGDTPQTVAAFFAANIPGATASGAVLTASPVVGAEVVCDQTAVYVAGQEQQIIRVAILAPNVSNPENGAKPVSGYLVRAVLARMVDGLKNLLDANGNVTRFIPLADTTAAQIRFAKQTDDDTPRNNDVWRRWQDYLCDYHETAVLTQPAALSFGAQVTRGSAAPIWIGNTEGS